MSTTSAVPHAPAPVHFGRRSTRGLLLGLSTARCVSAGAAIAVVVVGLVVGWRGRPRRQRLALGAAARGHLCHLARPCAQRVDPCRGALVGAQDRSTM